MTAELYPACPPLRTCVVCGRVLERRVYTSGPESTGLFRRRSWCSRRCAWRLRARTLIPSPDDPGVLLVPLTRGKVALIDASDAPAVAGYSWHAVHAAGRLWYAFARIDGREQTLHRFLMQPPAELQVDHINGDGLDCRRANMRIVPLSVNMTNCGPHRDNTSGYRGVYPQGGRWIARLVINGERRYLGQFATPEEAARAADIVLRERDGVHARLNFPE